MKHVYANLIGEWRNLSEDPNCKMGSNFSSPNIWWEEEGPTLFDYNYLNIYYRGTDYRIHPSFIQIVTTK